ncbi:MAG: hypothetical protein COC17_00460 [Hyphomicrobiales bacterium]|nr:hypothetical protein [Hyphomicrobiales bacterium]PCH51600.1 MAG: hypothetical protein COC17_00460 [Hyphomicrobiales bacterium]
MDDLEYKYPRLALLLPFYRQIWLVKVVDSVLIFFKDGFISIFWGVVLYIIVVVSFALYEFFIRENKSKLKTKRKSILAFLVLNIPFLTIPIQLFYN